MQRAIPAAVDRTTALRYMGASGWQPDSAAAAMLDRAEAALLAAATPRAAWKTLPRAAFVPKACGEDLRRHLAGCDTVLLLAATLGTEVDSLLRRLEMTDIAMATAADAMASVLLEQVCDEWESEMRAQFLAEKRYLTTRYAPGYGDCPLELNDALCRAVDSVRGCGLAVTPQHLLTPRKSTTAILGVADHPVTGAQAGCKTCHLRETCAFRSHGTTCFSNDKIPPKGD